MNPLLNRLLSPAVHELRLGFIALQFFTRCPIPRWVGFEPAWLQQCARYFIAAHSTLALNAPTSRPTAGK